MFSDVAALSSPGAVCVVGDDSPLRSRRHSWRQQIFLRVATPQKGSDSKGNTLVEYASRVHQCKTSHISNYALQCTVQSVPLHAAVTVDIHKVVLLLLLSLKRLNLIEFDN